ncbi:hypothetical protein ACIQXI_08335 [Lysinibacillus sp. NPDC097195]|uniref:hypothetical protein n=1 Tax=Lysinibacillus sp. NPDC097195 TaxID=3364141 RepID=UPI00381B34AD
MPTMMTEGAVYFIAFQKKVIQLATFKEGMSKFSPTIYWLCAIGLSLLTAFVVRTAIQRGADKKFVLALGFIAVLLFGNSAFYLQNQLAQPITVPLAYDFYSGNETHDLNIHYVTNKSDHRAVQYLQAGEVTLFAHYYEQPAKDQPMFYYPADVTEQGRYQLMRSAYFIGNKDEMQKLIDSGAIYLVLDDGKKLSTTLQLDFERPADEVAYSFVSSSGSNNGIQTAKFRLMQDAVFDEVLIPEILQGSIEINEIDVNGKTLTTEDFPIAVKKDQLVSISLQSKEAALDLQKMVGISGPEGILPIWILRKAPFDIKNITEGSLPHD